MGHKYTYMKKIILSLSVLTLLLTGCATTSTQSTTAFTSISQLQFESLQTQGAVVIDLRTPAEIASGKIAEDAIEINYYDEDFSAQLAELDPEQTYLLYCRSGNRSGKALTQMEDLGFTEAYDLKGGISAWK